MEKPVKAEELIKVTEYNVLGNLPDPFVFDNGHRVATVSDWEKRRKEIYKTAVELQYGRQPSKPEYFRVERLSECTPGGALQL